ncbi:MAG: helix-turn-helix domain-containing protein [Solirubrobacteraceae bacterium]
MSDPLRVDPLKLFAANVRRIRHERGLTQEQLAFAAEMCPTHVSKIERCECEPGARTIAKIATALQVSGGPLFDGIDGR